MGFGSLGATSSAAVDNMATVLKIITMMGEMPSDFIVQAKSLLEDIASQNAASKATQADITAQQAELARLRSEVQSKQDALDEHIAKLRKLTE
jgi:septal ring factor EnvC (AmiA/AmiB activator)